MTDEASASASITTLSGGVNLTAQRIDVGGDVVGRDKITVGYTVEQVSTLLTQIGATFQPSPFDGRCPYLGLEAFTEEDADRFFGRERLIADLIARVTASRFLLIAGPSGSGKSSLVRAGLIHALKHGALPASHSERWLYATVTPGRDPIEQLALAMSRLAKSPEAGDYVRRHAVDADASALHKFAESSLSDRPDQRAVIFVDQFEEVFTQTSREDDRVTFLNLLTHAATIEGGRVTVLFALRSDFVSNCATYPPLNALLNQQFMQVGAMQADELVSAIARPALQVGLRIDPDLVKQIVDDMGDEPGELPLMQFALKDLFDVEQAKGGLIALTLSDYLARGGLRRSLERHADAAFAKLSPTEQQLARSIFSGLIEIGSGREDTRRTASFAELVPAAAAMDPVKAVIQKLADARLVTTDQHSNEYTITHEKLINAWPWLRKLIDDNRESIALQNQIAEDAQEWAQNQRDASYLYSGARLANAREQLAEQKIGLSELAQAFVEAGIQAEQNELEEVKRRAAQLRRGTVYLAGALGLAVLLGIMAGIFGAQSNTLANQNARIANTAQANADEAQRQARLAVSRQLAAQGVAQAATDPDLGILLARAANNLQNRLGLSDTLGIKNSLLTSMLSGPRPLQYLRGHTKPVLRVAISPDSQWAASASEDETIRIWDIVSGRTIYTLTGHVGAVNAVAFSPISQPPVLVSGGADGTVRLWKWTDVDQPPQAEMLLNLAAPVQTIAFSPNELRLAIGGNDKTIRVYDLDQQRVKYQLTGHTGIVYALAFNSDGTRLASNDSQNDVRLWDMTTGQALNRSNPNAGLSGQVYNSVVFGPDNSYVVTGQGSRVVWAYTNDLTTDFSYAPYVDHTSLIREVAYSHDGTRFASASEDWRIGYCYSVSCQSVIFLTGHDGPVNSVAFSADDKWLISGGDDGNVLVWNAQYPYVARSLAGPLLQGRRWNVEGLAFSPDSQTLVSSNWDGSIRLWTVETGAILHEFYPNQGTLGVIALSPDGTKLAFSAEAGPYRVWNLDGTVFMTLPIKTYITGVAFSPDGKWLATDNDSGKSVCLWALDSTQSVCQPLPGNERASRFAFSPDGRTLASDSGPNVRLWDITARPLISRTLGAHKDGIFSLAFSPDGKWLASGGSDYTIHLWDIRAEQPTSITLRNSGRFMRSVAFSPDGRMLVSVNEDWTVRWWDVETGQPLVAPVKVRFDRIDSVAFSPDGRWLATGSFDGIIDLWPGNIDEWKTTACQIANRNLTKAEWDFYVGNIESYQATCP